MAENDKRELEDILRKLISMKSVTGEENRIMDFLENYLGELGFKVEREYINERYNIFAFRGNPKYLIATHVDTVPLWGFKKGFNPVKRYGRIYGRGAIDTKGQIASLLLALKRTENPCAVSLFVDEEKEGKGSERFKPKFRFEGAIVLEPTDFKICNQQCGSIEIYLEVEGRTAHGAIPEKGKNAIDEFIRIYREVKRIRKEINLGWIRGGIDCQIVPRICKGEIDVIIYPGEDINLVKREIEKIIKKYPARIEIKVFDEPVAISKEEKVVKILEKALHNIRKVEYSIMKAWTDAANLIEKGIPSVIFGAGDLEIAHTERENIRIRDMLNLCRVLGRFIEISANRDICQFSKDLSFPFA